MVTYLVYAPISFFFDSVATISLKMRFTVLVQLWYFVCCASGFLFISKTAQPSLIFATYTSNLSKFNFKFSIFNLSLYSLCASCW